jgi:copper chaperone
MIKLKIEGMTCGHCVASVKEALAAVPGVSGPVEVSLERGIALVQGTAQVQPLLAAVAAEGYRAVVAD